MLRQLAVHEPAALSTETWRAHVNACAECFAEWRAFATSLALYEQVERREAERHAIKPSWDAYRRRMEEERHERRRMAAISGAWLAGMVGLVLFGGAMSWGLWDEGGFQAGSAVVIDEEALQPGFVEARPTRRVEFTSVRNDPVPAPGGSYGPMSAELRLLRRWKLLEPHIQAVGRPSSEIAIIPFSHGNGATPYVMPSTSAPGSGIRMTFANAPATQGGYTLSTPVH